MPYTDEQIAAVRELMNRKAGMDPNRAAAVDELSRRMGLSTEIADAARQSLSEHAHVNPDTNQYEPNELKGPSVLARGSAVVKGVKQFGKSVGQFGEQIVDANKKALNENPLWMVANPMGPTTKALVHGAYEGGKKELTSAYDIVRRDPSLLDPRTALDPDAIGKRSRAVGHLFAGLSAPVGGSQFREIAEKIDPFGFVGTDPTPERVLKRYEGYGEAAPIVATMNAAQISRGVKTAAGEVGNTLVRSGRRSLGKAAGATGEELNQLSEGTKLDPALDRGGYISVSRQGLRSNLSNQADKYGGLVREQEGAIPRGEVSVDHQALLDHMAKEIHDSALKTPEGKIITDPKTGQILGKTAEHTEHIRKLEELTQEILNNPELHDTVDVRQSYDNSVAGAKGFEQRSGRKDLSLGSRDYAKREASSGLRDSINETTPDIAPNRKAYSSYKSALDIVTKRLSEDWATVWGVPKTILRNGVYRLLAYGGGAAIGGPVGAAVAAVDALQAFTRWTGRRTVMAAVKYKIGRFLQEGDLAGAAELANKAMGRTTGARGTAEMKGGPTSNRATSTATSTTSPGGEPGGVRDGGGRPTGGGPTPPSAGRGPASSGAGAGGMPDLQQQYRRMYQYAKESGSEAAASEIRRTYRQKFGVEIDAPDVEQSGIGSVPNPAAANPTQGPGIEPFAAFNQLITRPNWDYYSGEPSAATVSRQGQIEGGHQLQLTDGTEPPPPPPSLTASQPPYTPESVTGAGYQPTHGPQGEVGPVAEGAEPPSPKSRLQRVRSKLNRQFPFVPDRPTGPEHPPPPSPAAVKPKPKPKPAPAATTTTPTSAATVQSASPQKSAAKVTRGAKVTQGSGEETATTTTGTTQPTQPPTTATVRRLTPEQLDDQFRSASSTTRSGTGVDTDALHKLGWSNRDIRGMQPETARRIVQKGIAKNKLGLQDEPNKASPFRSASTVTRETKPKPEPVISASTGTRTNATFKEGDLIELPSDVVGEGKFGTISTVGHDISRVRITNAKGETKSVNLPNETLNKYREAGKKTETQPVSDESMAKGAVLKEGLGEKLKAAVANTKKQSAKTPTGEQAKIAVGKVSSHKSKSKGQSKVGTTVSTPKGSGTITDTFTHPRSGTTIYRVDVNGESTVIDESKLPPGDFPVTQSVGRNPYKIGDHVTGTDINGEEHSGSVVNVGSSPRYGPYVEIKTRVGRRIITADKVQHTSGSD